MKITRDGPAQEITELPKHDDKLAKAAGLVLAEFRPPDIPVSSGRIAFVSEPMHECARPGCSALISEGEGGQNSKLFCSDACRKIVFRMGKTLDRESETAEFRLCANCDKAYPIETGKNFCSDNCANLSADYVRNGDKKTCACKCDHQAPFTPGRKDQKICNRCSRIKNRNVTEFIGVDGEGVTGGCLDCDCGQFISDPGYQESATEAEKCQNCWHPKYGESSGLKGHDHKYVELGVGDAYIINPDGLHWKEILEFLYREFQRHHGETAFVGYYLGYDFTQWFKTLPWDRAEQLFDKKMQNARKHKRKGVDPHPVECERWQFDILGDKRVKIRPKLCECETATCPIPKCDCPKEGKHRRCKHACKQAQWMYICDAGSFFQTAFLKAIKPKDWHDPEIREALEKLYPNIEEGKGRRETAQLDEKMIAYNHDENSALAIIMGALDEGLRELGIRLARHQWMGPGQPAGLWMKLRIPNRETIESVYPSELIDDAMGAHSAGWFEIFGHGIVWGLTYQYDINSAYPYTMGGHGKTGALRYSGYPEDWGLPCLGKMEDGEFVPHLHVRRTIHRKPKTELPKLKPGQLMLVRAHIYGSNEYIGAMPHRKPESADIDCNGCRKSDWLVQNGYPKLGANKKYTADMNQAWEKHLRQLDLMAELFEAATGATIDRPKPNIPYRIYRPQNTSGLFWSHELQAAIDAKLVDRIEVLYSWILTPTCDCLPPLAEMQDLYLTRLRHGKETVHGKACKLIYNAVSGKLQQSIGEAPYCNWIYASLITAGVRTIITRAIADHPEGAKAALMVATDAAYFTSPHPRLEKLTSCICEQFTPQPEDDPSDLFALCQVCEHPKNGKLGNWSLKVHENICLFKPGFYWDEEARKKLADNDTPDGKTRGVSKENVATVIAKSDIEFQNWTGPDVDEDGEFAPHGWPEVPIRIRFGMITARQALARHNWGIAGQVITPTVIQSSYPGRKRAPGGWDSALGIYRSRPYAGDWEGDHPERSMGYKPEMAIRFREENGEQIPAEDSGISDDANNITDEYADMLGLKG